MLAHLEKSDSVYVKFDARRDGVVLPAHLKRDAAVVLQYGLNMRIPIPDLDIGAEGIGATLSFNRNPVWTFIPWSAVFAIVSENGAMLWENDLPRDLELDDGRASKGPAKKAADARASKPPKRPSLRAVDGGRREDDAPVSSAPAEPSAASASGGERMASLIDELPSEPLLAPVETAPAVAPVSPLAAVPPLAAVAPVTPAAPIAVAAPVAAAAPVPESSPAAPASEATPPAPSRPEDEIVELPNATKKKRELPPWLRVVK
jgi:hypothetical protein